MHQQHQDPSTHNPLALYHIPATIHSLLKPFINPNVTSNDIDDFVRKLPIAQYILGYNAVDMNDEEAKPSLQISEHWHNVLQYLNSGQTQLSHILTTSSETYLPDTGASSSHSNINEVAKKFCNEFILDNNSSPRSDAFLLTQLTESFQTTDTIAGIYDKLMKKDSIDDDTSHLHIWALLLASLQQLSIRPNQSEPPYNLRRLLRANPYKALLYQLGHPTNSEPEDLLELNANFLQTLLASPEPPEAEIPQSPNRAIQTMVQHDNAHLIFLIHFILKLTTVHRDILNTYTLESLQYTTIQNWLRPKENNHNMPSQPGILTASQNPSPALTVTASRHTLAWQQLSHIRRSYQFHSSHSASEDPNTLWHQKACTMTHYLSTDAQMSLLQEVATVPAHERLLTLAAFWLPGRDPTAIAQSDPTEHTPFGLALTLLKTPDDHKDPIRALFKKLSPDTASTPALSISDEQPITTSTKIINQVLASIGAILQYKPPETPKNTTPKLTPGIPTGQIKNIFSDNNYIKDIMTNIENIYDIFNSQERRLNHLKYTAIIICTAFIVAIMTMSLTQLYIAGAVFTPSILIYAVTSSALVLLTISYIGYLIADHFAPLKTLWDIDSIPHSSNSYATASAVSTPSDSDLPDPDAIAAPTTDLSNV